MPRQVSLLLCRDVFVCRTCLGHNCSVEEKLEFKRGSAWKKLRELKGVLFRKQCLSLKQQGKLYQCCVRPVLLYCCETWERSVADDASLHGGEHRMIRMICGVRLVDRVSTDILP